MKTSQILMSLAIIGGIVGYWWLYYGRHGGAEGYMRRQLGLRDAEQIRAVWTCYYDTDLASGEGAGELLSRRVHGINVMLALTSENRLTIGDNEKGAAPRMYEHGQISITKHSDAAKIGTLAGPTGMERAVVMRLAPLNEPPFRLQIAQSGLQAAMEWARR